MPFLINPYIFGGGLCLAAQSGVTDILKLSQGGVEDSGINGGGSQNAFAKNGNEILSSGPYIYSADNGASFSTQGTSGLYPNINNAGFMEYSAGLGKWLTAGGFGGSQQQYLGYSSDRTNWTTVAVPNMWNTYGIAASNTEVCIVGQDGPSGSAAMWYTTDLANFTKVSVTSGYTYFGNGYFIFGPSGTNIQRAASGSLGTVSTIALNNSDGSLSSGAIHTHGITYSPFLGRWVFVYYSVALSKFKAQYSDDDGATWNIANCDFSRPYASVIYGVVPLPGGGFIAHGALQYNSISDGIGYALYSTDGDTWAEIPGATSFKGLTGAVAL